MVHVTEEEESIYEYDPAIDMIFRNIDFAYDRQTLQGNLADTLNNYCQQKNMDLLCMVHHQKGWLRRLFSKSVTASELFNLTVPLLVLPD